MFKRKYVKMSSERVIEKIEDFLQKNNWNERLEPNELYAFRYALSGMKINIINPSIVKRIGLNDISSTFKSSKFIIFSENDKYGVKSDDDILDVCSNLNKKIIFLIFSNNGKFIEQICIYLPSPKDTTLFINGIYHCENDICVADSEEDFIRCLAKHDENLFKHHLQDEKIIPSFELNFEKEFFTFTKLNINGSTITFHYVP